MCVLPCMYWCARIVCVLFVRAGTVLFVRVNVATAVGVVGVVFTVQQVRREEKGWTHSAVEQYGIHVVRYM